MAKEIQLDCANMDVAYILFTTVERYGEDFLFSGECLSKCLASAFLCHHPRQSRLALSQRRSASMETFYRSRLVARSRLDTGHQSCRNVADCSLPHLLHVLRHCRIQRLSLARLLFLDWSQLLDGLSHVLVLSYHCARCNYFCDTILGKRLAQICESTSVCSQ